jgi:hypothetical protein
LDGAVGMAAIVFAIDQRVKPPRGERRLRVR